VTSSNYVIKMTSQKFSIFKPPLSKVLVALLNALPMDTTSELAGLSPH